MVTAYPPSPWTLRGSLTAALWRVPRGDLPSAPSLSPVVWRGQVLLATAFACYGPGSLLDYREFLLLLPLRRWRPSGTVTQIWVDSPASAAGGRALWGIPKELGGFAGERLLLAGRPAAALRFSPGWRLPGRWPFCFRTLQPDPAGPQAARLRGRARLRFGRGCWRFDPAGPLGFLAGRRPLVTVRLEEMTLRFGL